MRIYLRLFCLLLLVIYVSGYAQSSVSFPQTPPDRVNGWIILDDDSVAVRETIEKAYQFGVNHIQLSHHIIMNIDDILGDNAEARYKVDVLNKGIAWAHHYNMKAYIWVHEFSGVPRTTEGRRVCYSPDSPIWHQRKEAYRKGLAKIPDLDGVIFMYGSAPVPPWRTSCDCDWCVKNGYANSGGDAAQAKRIRLVTENIGGYIANDLGKELFIRTFVHEPAEIEWHNSGLSSARSVEFTGMHKGPVQDWQPYNPHHGSTGNIGDHPCVMELDIAGELYGLSILPLCSPGYYWYRMQYNWDHDGLGTVIRVQRNEDSALGTPNMINVYAITKLNNNHNISLESIWDDFIADFYHVSADHPKQTVLKKILKNTFPIRLKSHYVLGIWAHNKNSDVPRSTELNQFRDRGKMQKWEADWEPIWNALNQPDMNTLHWIWQEGTEAMVLADESIELLPQLKDVLSQKDYKTVSRWLQHQRDAAEIWRAADIFTFADMAADIHPDNKIYPRLSRWSYDESLRMRNVLIEHGFSNMSLAGVSSLDRFLKAEKDNVPQNVKSLAPDYFTFSPVHINKVNNGSVTFSFATSDKADVTVLYGEDLPFPEKEYHIGIVPAGQTKEVTLTDLQPHRRYVLRLVTEMNGQKYWGGEYWIFTK